MAWWERVECSEDGRGAFVVITPQGRAAIEEAAPGHVRAVRRLMFDALSEEERASLAPLKHPLPAPTTPPPPHRPRSTPPPGRRRPPPRSMGRRVRHHQVRGAAPPPRLGPRPDAVGGGPGAGRYPAAALRDDFVESPLGRVFRWRSPDPGRPRCRRLWRRSRGDGCNSGSRLDFASAMPSSRVRALGQCVEFDGEGATESVEVVDEMDCGRGWHEHPELGRARGHPIADRVEQLLAAERMVRHYQVLMQPLDDRTTFVVSWALGL